MGTSNTEFGLLLAALSLSGTWTPLVGGVMTARLGTTVSSIIATGTVFLGQALLLMGHLHNEVWLMILGMFIFGLGQSPLAGLSYKRTRFFFQLKFYSPQLHKKPSSYVSSSLMDSVYLLVCIILHYYSSFQCVTFSSWTRCWKGGFIRLSTLIISSLTMVSKRPILRFRRCRWVLIPH